ncbi:MAG TPA: AmiS/UreI family transporter [Actinomycetota bacterium]
MPPIAIVFFLTGIAVWANALYFLGVAAERQEGGSDPLRAVGWITLLAGISNFWQVSQIGTQDNLLGGLVVFYAAFFTFLGITEILALDLRVLGHVSIAVALLPLVYWDFLSGSWMLQSILVVWAIVFLAIAAVTYGRLSGRVLGVLLLATAIYTFWIPASILALGNTIP